MEVTFDQEGFWPRGFNAWLATCLEYARSGQRWWDFNRLMPGPNRIRLPGENLIMVAVKNDDTGRIEFCVETRWRKFCWGSFVPAPDFNIKEVLEFMTTELEKTSLGKDGAVFEEDESLIIWNLKNSWGDVVELEGEGSAAGRVVIEGTVIESTVAESTVAENTVAEDTVAENAVAGDTVAENTVAEGTS